MTTKAQHTKGPLIVCEWTCHAKTTLKTQDGDKVIAEVTGFGRDGDECEADAAELVRRWNCHDELLEVCQMVASSIKVDELALITAARAAIARATT
jgi:hypothetical protein